jgi:hypothetical protein
VVGAQQYCRLPGVQRRIREFCGIGTPDGAGCIYVSALGPRCGPYADWGSASTVPPSELERELEEAPDLGRSLWDASHLLVYLDLDYLNADHPGDAFLHPAHAFLGLEPAYSAVRDLCDACGMPLADLATGEGYNFAGRVPLTSPVVDRLADLAPGLPSWHPTQRMRRPPWLAAEIDERYARAHYGLGLVLEHAAHWILARASPASRIPLVIDNTHVGTGLAGRECASLDLSHLGDPLDTRCARAAFSLYQKHRLRPDLVGPLAALVPPLATIPRMRGDILRMLEIRRDLTLSAQLALDTPAAIPVITAGLLRLVEAYERSPLAAFHRAFYAVEPHRPAEWAETYDRLDHASLPPCARAALERPNDLLLRPDYLQLLTRVLLGADWHPRHVAGLVHSRYVRETSLSEHWKRVDPAMRAEFDVRVFAGLVATGLDQGVDLNCVSTQQKDLCPGDRCTHDLRDDRARLPGRWVA